MKPESAAAPRARPHTGRRFVRLAFEYFNNSGNKWRVRAAVLLLLALTVGQVVLAIWMSYWNRDLFYALES